MHKYGDKNRDDIWKLQTYIYELCCVRYVHAESAKSLRIITVPRNTGWIPLLYF
jgi:hypothetical protein